jgi:hypothetical protein
MGSTVVEVGLVLLRDARGEGRKDRVAWSGSQTSLPNQATLRPCPATTDLPRPI